MALQMAVKAVNDTAGPDGLVPTLLVFGAYPRLTNYDPPAPSIQQWAATLKKATDEVQKIYAKEQVSRALHTRNGPSSTSNLNLPINSEVLVWREKEGWKGPYRLLSTDGESCMISISNTAKKFRSTSVKPYYSQYIDPKDVPPPPSVVIPPPPSVVIPSSSTTYIQFEESRQKEVNGLLEKGVFEIAYRDNIPKGTRIFNS